MGKKGKSTFEGGKVVGKNVGIHFFLVPSTLLGGPKSAREKGKEI